jgi:hypothetical protein
LREWTVDEFHRQKRKYRWANGSTLAGSQVSTRPSAFTV